MTNPNQSTAGVGRYDGQRLRMVNADTTAKGANTATISRHAISPLEWCLIVMCGTPPNASAERQGPPVVESGVDVG